MQEIGTWVTEAGSVPAIMELGAQETGGEFELPAWASGALQGAAVGATTGAAAGPYGVLIGGVAGAAIGGATAATAPKPPKTQPTRPAAAPKPAPRPTTTSAPATPTYRPNAPTPAGGTDASTAQAMQQFTALLPALMQLLAASNAPAAASSTPPAQAEVFDATEWAVASMSEGAWTVT